MKKTTKNKRVIKSKNASFKKNLEKVTNFIKSHKLVTIISLLVVIILCLILFIPKNKTKVNESYADVILSIDDEDYLESDYMIYFYSVKYNYFKTDDVSSENLDVVIDDDNNTTVRDYLKDEALDEIKAAAAIKKYAKNQKVELTDAEEKELEESKKDFISSLGGQKEFSKFLKSNKTTEESYDKMAKTDKLYSKILEKLYSEGKRFDLSDEEKANAKVTYQTSYYKIEQVILATVDATTGVTLGDTAINQKQMLANTILAKANEKNANFEDLIKKYSEDAEEKEAPYYSYYKTGELLTELEEAVSGLKNNEVSKVIQTKYAFHIIKKLELDDAMFDSYLNDLREEKAISDLNETLDSLKLIYKDAFKSLEV